MSAPLLPDRPSVKIPQLDGRVDAMSAARTHYAVRRAVAVVAALNLAYFGIEFAVAARIGSVSLFADSIDFLEDTAVNILVFVGLAWSARRRAKLAMALALLLLLPGLATL
jgi:Co/Zn/Cd efflux system component